MQDELSQAELDRIFYGTPPRVEATFYDYEALDPEASAEAGQRVMKTALYIHLVCEKEHTEINRPATKQDKAMFAREFSLYRSQKEAPSESRNVQDLRPREPRVEARQTNEGRFDFKIG